MTRICAIDPGTTKSALVEYDSDGRSVLRSVIADNEKILAEELPLAMCRCPHVAIEMIASYGMAVGREVFETCVWIGRFWQKALAYDAHVVRIYRKDVKLFLCGSTRAKDTNIRQSLIDLFGGPECIKKGGSLYGVRADMWAALGVAVTTAGG